MAEKEMDLRGAVLAFFLCVVFGSNALAIKISVLWMPPILTAAVRFLIASLVVYAYAKWKGYPLGLDKNEWFHATIMGGLFGIQFIVLYIGIKSTSVSHSAILMNTQPFFVAILAHFFLIDDRLNLKKIFGIALAFVGVILMFRHGAFEKSASLRGDTLITVSALVWAVQTVYIKRKLDDWDSIPLVLIPMVISDFILIAYSVFFEQDMTIIVNQAVVLSMLYQAVFVAGYGYIAWTDLILRYKASHLSVFVFILPVTGTILGAIFMGDPLTLDLLGGLLCITVGILVVNIRPREAFVVPE